VRKKITIVIPFLNEGDAPIRTVESIYDTAKSKLFNIIAVEEPSKILTRGLDKFPDLSLLRNNERLGAEMSKTKGALLAETPYLFIIDAHMRFRNDHWLENIIDALEDEPYTAFCTKCIGLDSGNMDIDKPDRPHFLGARYVMYEHHGNAPDKPKDFRDIIEAKWAYFPENEKELPRIYEIPCLMGANYGFSKQWFSKVKGFYGLRTWGSGEPYISLKYWMAGGKVKVIRDIGIGHIFRPKNPYPPNVVHVIYNKMFMANVLFPHTMGRELVGFLGSNEHTLEASKQLEANVRQVEYLRNYYRSIFTRSIYDVLDDMNVDYKFPEELRSELLDEK
jgi:glycosyltransferase involved in cell wall biosynthesis